MTEEAIFHEALARTDPTARAAFLAEHCPDPDLRARVDALLAAHDQSAGVLERPAATGAYTPGPDDAGPAPDASERPGTRIGPYKLLQKIGEGGMGAVWMAEQEQPVRRKVALKLIKPGMDSAQVVARFEAERQALALMDHPNIAKVLDAGTTPAGRPFFVMELVKGVPITKYCDDAHLTPRERLELFIPVCQAVQHAHQKGIIHRDIKPSNVLVALYDGKPVPKIIDFGVAKALHTKLTERTVFTEFGQVVGTLEYMSPEQAELNQLDIDTRSDIYSLGVLLYELLTGTTPFDRQRLRKAAFAEVLRIIREEEPPRPSTKLSGSAELPSIAANRRTEPKRLGKLVSGDLDWVVMKCLEKDRSRRYETANGLALDVQRYLADEPVEAGPPSARYRLRKFTRKYRRPLLVVGAFSLLLIAGAAVSAWQAVRATREAARANLAERQARDEAAIAKAVNEFLNEDLLGQADPDELDHPDLTPVKETRLRTVLDRAAAKIGGKFDKQPLVEAAVRLTIAGAYFGLTDYDNGRPHAERAYELRRRELGEEHLDTMKALSDLACFDWIQGRTKQGEQRFTKVLEVRHRELGDKHVDTLAAMHCLAMTLQNDERIERLLTDALQGRREALGEEDPSTLATALFLTSVYMRQGKLDQAERLFLQNLEVNRRLRGENHYYTVRALGSLARLYEFRGQYAQAEPLLVTAVDVYTRRLGEDNLITVEALVRLGNLYRSWGRAARAEPLMQQAVEGARRKYGEDGLTTLWALQGLAGAKFDLGKYVEAELLYARVTDASRRMRDPDHRIFARLLADQGRNLLKEEKYAQAEPPLRESRAFYEKNRPDDWQRFEVQSLVGESLSGQQKYAEAEPLLLSGYEGLKAREAKMPAADRVRLLTEAAERLMRLYDATNQPDKAKEWRAKLPPP
jgi:serine/threonine protein kinase/tetratricopeptide (TPR) repeat protein